MGSTRRKRGGSSNLLLVTLAVVAVPMLIHDRFGPGGLVALGVVIAALVFLAIELRQAADRAAIRWNFPRIDTMSGREFEEFVARIFRAEGANVRLTPATRDGGCDLVIVRGGRRIACQVKRRASSVGPGAVQEAVASVALYGCHGAMVVTNARFTASAVRLGRANGCELVDGADLRRRVRKAARGESKAVVREPGRARAEERR